MEQNISIFPMISRLDGQTRYLKYDNTAEILRRPFFVWTRS